MIEKRELDGNELWWLKEGPGAHFGEPCDAETVDASLSGRFQFVEESAERVGLRRPQLGALHAILAHRSTEENEPLTVVMPTGTGKTETMLATYCHTPQRTLVVVPSDALRSQIATKFATLGVLPTLGAITGDFRCPVVLVLKSRLQSVAHAADVITPANVIVATAQVLNACSDEARAYLAKSCRRLLVDEAHHLGARTWRDVVGLFDGREIVQFTATPYREDGRHLGGRIAYAYPLRLAQANGYFARINYHSVVDVANPDRALAEAAVRQLRADVDAGLDHLLMARVRSVERAKEVLGLYEEICPELAPVRIDTGLAQSSRRRHRDRLFGRTSRVVVCVNMLGEGFDLPALKIAAIHDPQKSLAVTLQFVGRFTRVGDTTLGEASAFVPLQVPGVDERLRRLFGEDADWNEVIRDLTEQKVGQERDRTEFESGFGSLPREVAMRSIHPKMSTVTYQFEDSTEWEPESIYDLFEDRLLTTQLGINNKDKVVWWVSRETTPVRWGESASFNELVHHLYVVHVDDDAGFLYINSTNNDSLHEDIAKAIGGKTVTLVQGDMVYRVLSRVKRRVPTNVGLLDAVSRNRRFSMHVGQDVLYAWRGEGGTKMKTNIFAHGFENGRAVSFGASRKGRVWSHEQARDIHDWVRWARRVGPTITDSSILLESVMSGFLLPEPARARPPYVPLAIEWPHTLVATLSERRQVHYDGESYSLLDTELILTHHKADQPIQFAVKTPTWELPFELEFHEDGSPTIRPLSNDGEAITSRGTSDLSAFLSEHGLFVTFEDEIVLIEQGFLLRPDREKLLYPPEAIETIDWSGVSIQHESQGAERDPSTVQHRAIQVLSAEQDWEIVLDDDGPGELADIVFMRRHEEALEVMLVHCKYSGGDRPGARIDDLYDVCGQSMKMNRTKAIPDLLSRRLLRREQKRQTAGKSGIVVGDIAALVSIVDEARYRPLILTVAIVQPGISKARVSDEMLTLLGGTERYLLDTHGMKLRVIGSV